MECWKVIVDKYIVKKRCEEKDYIVETKYDKKEAIFGVIIIL